MLPSATPREGEGEAIVGNTFETKERRERKGRWKSVAIPDNTKGSSMPLYLVAISSFLTVLFPPDGPHRNSSLHEKSWQSYHSSPPLRLFPIFPRITILFFPISFHYRRNIVQKGSNDSRKVILAYRAFPFDIRKVYSVIGGTVAQEKSIVSLEKGEKLVRKACVNVYSWDQGNGEAEAHISLWVRYTSKEFASWLTVPTWFILTKKRGKGFFHEKKEGTIEKGTGQLL